MTVPLAVTTAAKPSPETNSQAQTLSVLMDAPYIARLGRSLQDVYADAGSERLLICGGDHLRLHDRTTGAEYYYHPNMFVTRGSVVLHGGTDHFLRAVDLKPGNRLLDCTLGFGSEAALAALIVGDAGSVIGLESVPALAAVTRLGLQSFFLRSAPLTAALRRVEVITADSRDFLARCEPGAFDVIYFDPFFDERLSGSEASVSPLFVFGNPAPISPDAVAQARRIARQRVVIKHPGHIALPGPLPEWITQTIGGRKSRIIYSVIDKGSSDIKSPTRADELAAG